MKQITSKDNTLYKDVRQLATSAQARRKAGKTLLDGVHLAQAYLSREAPLLCVVAESALSDAEVSAVVDRCEELGAQCICLPDNLYQALSQVENGVGLLLVVVTPSATLDGPLSQRAVLLDQVQDPGNLGSILRSAAAAGIGLVLCAPGTAAAWSPKVLRAGMGAHFVLDIVEGVDLASVVRDAAVPVLATSSHTDKTIYACDLSQPVAWLFGHEGQGVDPDLLAMATEKVVIPHLGDIESLNVAAAAAVCFFEQVRQQMAAR